MKKSITAIITAIGSVILIATCSNVYADQEADTFLKTLSTLDAHGAHILRDYKDHIEGLCKRNVTEKELQLFQDSKEFAYLTSTATLQGFSSSDYKNGIASLSCE